MSFARRRHHAVPRTVSRPARRLGDRPRRWREGLWSLQLTQLRDFATDRHRTVDDTPAGGGAGMVLKPDMLAAAIDAVSHAERSAAAAADVARAASR